jgi:hypothetical protein
MEGRAQTPDPQTQQPRSRHYFIGIGLGLIVLLTALLGIGSSFATSNPLGGLVLIAATILYLIQIVAAIVCLIISRVRYIGYGLLTMVFVTPIVAAIACTVALATHS